MADIDRLGLMVIRTRSAILQAMLQSGHKEVEAKEFILLHEQLVLEQYDVAQGRPATRSHLYKRKTR